MQINGEYMALIETISLKQLLEETGYDENRIVVERNGDIISRETYAKTVLNSEDIIEILYFVGGGAV